MIDSISHVHCELLHKMGQRLNRHVERMPVTPSLRSRAGSEPMRFAQGKLREGSGSPDEEILRCAQDDSQALRMTARRSG